MSRKRRKTAVSFLMCHVFTQNSSIPSRGMTGGPPTTGEEMSPALGLQGVKWVRWYLRPLRFL